MTDMKPKRVAFYFAPHEDDWQLFMMPAAFRDVLDAGTHCVFVHLTAGDAGFGLGNDGRRYPLYLAREHGAETAIRFMADANGLMPHEPQTDAPVFAGHAIRRASYRNTVAYFPRLPDGNPEGSGYEATSFQSLKRLADGAIGTMTAIDGSADYFGWRDLVATLRALILGESDGLMPDLHVLELDPALNPGNHSDHRFTTRAVLDATAGLDARLVHHVGYAAAGRPANLTVEDRDLKSAVYAVSAAGMLAFDHPVAWRHYHTLYAGRDYSRAEARGAS